MTLIHIATFTADNRSATLAELIKAQDLENYEPQKAESGKPFLQDIDGRQVGLAISHVRRATPPFSIMAICEMAALGIDAEAWPNGGIDETFLTSIAAPEDVNIIAKALAAGRDPATLIWVLKEAALKASGDVMTDPRHLTVGPSINGHIQASASSSASAPLLRCMLRAFEMRTNATEQCIIVGVAIAGFEGIKNGPNLDVVCDNPHVKFTACDWLY